ncbi:MAG: inositol monophosphatase [Bacteroidaceae bacterium]|nr:inositol monophosphatase [Bacteroidaceae bacterium]
MDLQNITEQVKALAYEVGAFIRIQRENFKSERVIAKTSHDYVSYVDKEAEAKIIEGLKIILPESGFVTEESTDINNREERLTMDDRYEFCWIVDPLDGTTNFIHGLAPYCVSIALRNKEEILAGIVYEVSNDEMFCAYKGGGAFCNNKIIKTSAIKTIDNALLTIGLPYDVNKASKFYTHLSGKLYGNVASLRNLGSAEAELCYVAQGRIDAYIEPCIFPWDVAAGSIILKEAGGDISDFSGENKLWEQGIEVLATNGLIHQELQRVVEETKKEVNAVFLD